MAADWNQMRLTTLAKLREINYAVLNFARRTENLALLPKTRSHSTPFRGTVGSQYLQPQVADRLDRHPIDVLVVGSNANDVGDTAAATKYRPLQNQIDSGFFGEAYWSPEGKPVPGWSPFNDPKPGWQLLTAAIQEAQAESGSMGGATFANYIPWGSRDLEHLAAQTDPELLDRVVAFSDSLFEDVLQVLRPRIVLIVKSLTDNKDVGSRTGLKKHRDKAEKLAIPYRDAGGTKRLILESGAFKAAGIEMKLIHIGHPSWWTIPAGERSAVRRTLVKVLR